MVIVMPGPGHTDITVGILQFLLLETVIDTIALYSAYGKPEHRLFRQRIIFLLQLIQVFLQLVAFFV
jgi:heme/copper-type cytochrome/quinol oxidase subunit 4